MFGPYINCYLEAIFMKHVMIEHCLQPSCLVLQKKTLHVTLKSTVPFLAHTSHISKSPKLLIKGGVLGV